MTTYYNKVLEPVNNAIWTVNPALYLGNYAKFGNLPIELKDPFNTPGIHGNALKNYLNAIITFDEPGWADGAWLPDPTYIPLRTFTWSATVTWKQFQALQNDPEGLIAQSIRDHLLQQQDNFAKEIDHVMIGYLSQAGRDYMRDWNGAFSLRALVGSSASDPADCSSTPGTCTDLSTVNLSGAAQSVDAVNKTFGKTKRLFMQKYNTANKTAMYKKTNSYNIWGHPAAFDMVDGVHESYATGEIDFARPTLEAIAKLGEITPTFAVDEAYDGAADTVAEFAISMNTAENFFFVRASPYLIEGWKEYPPQVAGGNNVYRIRGFQRLGVLSKPYFMGTYYQKAVAFFKCTPYAEA